MGGRWLGAQREKEAGYDGRAAQAKGGGRVSEPERGTEKKTDEARAKAAYTAVMDCFSSNAQKMAALMCCFQQRTQYLRLRITLVPYLCLIIYALEPSRAL